jgi:hypothetical protein
MGSMRRFPEQEGLGTMLGILRSSDVLKWSRTTESGVLADGVSSDSGGIRLPPDHTGWRFARAWAFKDQNSLEIPVRLLVDQHAAEDRGAASGVLRLRCELYIKCPGCSNH